MTTQTGSAMKRVDEIAQPLLDDGRFSTIQEARAYVFRTRPELEDQVREETQVVKPVKAGLTAAEDAVEKAVRKLVADGEFPTPQQARAHVYETQPKLAAAVRKARS